MEKNITVSIIIVHYHVAKELFACLQSIIDAKPKVSYEIIVVDNDEEKTIKKDLKKRFPEITYIKSPSNIGFGAANNSGARIAKGKFLFFLNPDTLVVGHAIDELVDFIEKNKDVGIVAPLLLDQNKKPYPLQGTAMLTPFRAVICLSFINKYFPNNPIAKEYWLMDWDKRESKEVDVVPGTAFMIRKDTFEKIHGFDERFFLFFEENDVCLRVQKLRYKIYINPKAKVVHLWGSSTKKSKNIHKIFRMSRFLYFRKYFGVIKALLVEVFV